MKTATNECSSRHGEPDLPRPFQRPPSIVVALFDESGTHFLMTTLAFHEEPDRKW